MSCSRLKNGRFVKKKIFDKFAKATAAKKECRKRKLEELKEREESREKDIKPAKIQCTGRRIIEIDALVKNSKFKSCTNLLDFDKIEAEKRIGLHSVFTISCDHCKIKNYVDTGKIQNRVSNVNAAVVYGTIHSGAGCTALNKILACADIPQIGNDLYKRYEKIVGAAIEHEAKESCKRAALEEKKLVIKNIYKLCQEL